MKTVNYTRVDEAIASKISKQLNDLLANYQIFYTNVRGFHWNIEGEHFFTLHTQFEELYNSLAIKIDEIAERILMLGNKPISGFSSYLAQSEIKEVMNVSNGEIAVKSLLDSLAILFSKQRALLAIASEGGDDTTADFLTTAIVEQEKLVWMYSAFLKKN